ncbi:MAG: peptidase E [Opitutaceae bacterium]
MNGQILAMGGGSFLMEPENPLLDRYLLGLSRAERPSVCFLPHGTDNAERQTIAFFKAYAKLPSRPTYLSLFAPHTIDLEGFLMTQDIIYVGGGNTKSMLALWREWGLERILIEACSNGTVLAGVSAGANCWFEACTTDSLPGTLSALPCLGILKGCFTPHYDGEIGRRPALHRMMRDGELPSGWAADDGAAVHFIDGKPHRMVSSRPNAKVYRVDRVDGQVREEVQPTDYLGA